MFSLLNKIAKNKLPKDNETLARIDYDVNDDPGNVDVVGHDETITIKYKRKKIITPIAIFRDEVIATRGELSLSNMAAHIEMAQNHFEINRIQLFRHISVSFLNSIISSCQIIENDCLL